MKKSPALLASGSIFSGRIITRGVATKRFVIEMAICFGNVHQGM
jgi:hypothetical protein